MCIAFQRPDHPSQWPVMGTKKIRPNTKCSLDRAFVGHKATMVVIPPESRSADGEQCAYCCMRGKSLHCSFQSESRDSESLPTVACLVTMSVASALRSRHCRAKPSEGTLPPCARCAKFGCIWGPSW